MWRQSRSRGLEEIQVGQHLIAEAEHRITRIAVPCGDEALRAERERRAGNHAGQVEKQLICWIEHGATQFTAGLEILHLNSRWGIKMFL
jgi:hypothetical protein